MGDSRPRVTFITNQVRNWSHQRKTAVIARSLAEDYDVQLRFKRDLSLNELDAELERTDVALLYAIGVMHPMRETGRVYDRHREKLAIGLTGPLPPEAARRLRQIRILSNWAKAVFAVNRRIQQELRPLLDPPVFCTPNGVDTTFFRRLESRADRGGPLRVGWTGSRDNYGEYYRGLPNLLQPAVSAVDGAELVVAAREDRWRTPDEMRDWYASLDVYVCGSVRDGMPNGPLEAAACGVPTISTPVGAMPEFIIDGVTGYVMPPDVDAWAGRLRELRDDPATRRQMGRMARLQAESWSWTRQSHAFRLLFEWMLDR